MVSTSINLPPEMLDEIDTFIEESLVFESRGHYFRVAHEYLQDELETGSLEELKDL